MSKIDDGYLKVRIGGDTVRRPAIVEPAVFNNDGNVLAFRTRPALYPGEALVETIGEPPRILRDK